MSDVVICLVTGIILSIALLCAMDTKSPSRLDLNDLQRVRRLSDKIHQDEIQPLE
jgi:hypothetical protein